MKALSKVALVILTTTMGLSAHAKVGRDGGGGVVFVCNEAGKEKVYLADTYSIRASFSNDQKNTDFGGPLQSLIISLQTSSAQSKEIADNLKSLKFKHSPPMALLGDDDIKNEDIPRGCVKKQLAIQTLSTGEVDVDIQLYSALTRREQALFILHEGYVAKYRANTTQVRHRVAREAMLAYANNNAPMDDWAAFCKHSHAYAKTFLDQVKKPSDWTSEERDERTCYSLIRAGDLFMGPGLIKGFSKEKYFSTEFNACYENFEKEFEAKVNLLEGADKDKCVKIYHKRSCGEVDPKWSKLVFGVGAAFHGHLSPLVMDCRDK